MSSREDSDTDSMDDNPIPANPNHANLDEIQSQGDPETSQTTPKCTIHITSHGHRFGPLRIPAPQTPVEPPPVILQYDVRALPNPPKNVRAGQTGLHKALREWVLSTPEAAAKHDEVCTAISAALGDVSARRAYPVDVHVVIYCEMGRHRSVALVEELGRQPFFVDGNEGPERCQLIVRHRDVGRGKQDERRRRQRADPSSES
ncbi:hypothetical protein FB451DRAFT_1150658 [Mycena latifolia]|nr:hypothetical protein FB451DRAFT_1150658 [Mycena latifolia]